MLAAGSRDVQRVELQSIESSAILWKAKALVDQAQGSLRLDEMEESLSKWQQQLVDMESRLQRLPNVTSASLFLPFHLVSFAAEAPGYYRKR